MDSHTALLGRPGLSWGSYPERRDHEESEVERWVGARIQTLRARRAARPAAMRQIVASIEEAGESLARMPDEFLQMSITGLRMRLARDRSGAEQDLVIQAFAAVREIAGRTLGMRHFPSQIMGGWVLYHGMLAQMQTGEGKTLTATLPAATAAMAGVPVHVVTANDYLAARDLELMRPVYTALGLSCAVIEPGMDDDERRAAYACDITYCTNKHIAFDYLRDRLTRGNGASVTHNKVRRLYDGESAAPLLRGLCYAIVDEADSVLVDEARTPLILSRPVSDDTEAATYQQALELASALTLDADFTLDRQSRQVFLTERGEQTLLGLSEALGGLWTARRHREELVCQALSALHHYIRDRHYLVKDDSVQIIDEYTGRLMPDRSWERGLHQLVETKEGCGLTPQKETLAKISYQRFFQRYLRLAGMTGTAGKIEHELATVYGLPVIDIPTHRPTRRIALRPRTFASKAAKYDALLTHVAKMRTEGRPVLVGTRSVENSEAIGLLFRRAGVEVEVLNAREDAVEAHIIARAGEAGRVTVATNMAGRGTDIDLSEAAEAAGGLHVVLTERNEAWRIDRQLIGRCSRQGDPGSFQIFASLDDEVPAAYFGNWLSRLLGTLLLRQEFPSLLGNWLMNLAQSALERQHQRARKALQRQDEHLGDLLAFTGQGE